MSTLPVVISQETHFTTIGNRQVAKRSFSNGALEEHLNDHLTHPSNYRTTGEWCTPACAARAFSLRATEENQSQMRERFTRASLKLLDRGLLLLKEYQYGKHGPIIRVKLFDCTSEVDVHLAAEQLEQTRERGDMSDRKLKKMESIIGRATEAATTQSATLGT